MDCHLVDVHYFLEAFRGARIRNFDIKPTDGTKIFTYQGNFETD